MLLWKFINVINYYFLRDKNKNKIFTDNSLVVHACRAHDHVLLNVFFLFCYHVCPTQVRSQTLDAYHLVNDAIGAEVVISLVAVVEMLVVVVVVVAAVVVVVVAVAVVIVNAVVAVAVAVVENYQMY